MKVKVKKLLDTAILPTLGSDAAAGYDLYAAKACVIEPGQMVLVHTGLAMEIAYGWWGGIYARSGLATKRGLRPANCVGVIDSDYRGEVIVALYNDSGFDQEIKVGDRIAQFILDECTRVEWEGTDTLDETERSSGGFGSTGLQ